MSSHDNGDGFWSGERDWTDSHRRQGRVGRTSIGDRLRTGVNSVLDVGASAGAGRQHGESGRTPVVEPSMLDDTDPLPQPDDFALAAAGLSIGELAMPWDGGIHEPTMPIERTNVAVAERPPGFDAAPLEQDPPPADHGDETAWGDEWAPETYPVPPPRGGVDPLLAKLGVLAVALTLLLPFLLSLRNDSSDRIAGASETPSTLGVIDLFDEDDETSDDTAAANDASSTAAAGATGSDAAHDSDAPHPSASTASASTAGSSASSAGSGAQASDSAAASVAESNVTVAAEKPHQEPQCVGRYNVVAGDYWTRLAGGAGVPLSKLLAANSATASTPLYPGRSICLPPGSSTPPPPPAASSGSKSSGSSSASSKSSGSSSSGSSSKSSGSSGSSKPAATTPSATHPPAPAPPPPSPSAAAVKQIIRDVWPDELEEKALAIAWRESNYIATAKNYCCSGLFQIYYSVHKSWLAGIGVTSANQLFDARTNARAAYVLYQRAGGWGPWGG